MKKEDCPFPYVFEAKTILDRVSKLGAKTGGLGASLLDINWDNIELEQFQKNFYIERQSVKGRAEAEVIEFRKQNSIYIYGIEPLPPPIFNFKEAPFPEYIMKRLLSFDFLRPTPIQCQAWPAIMTGRDIVGISETGSGKTLAYTLPGIVHLNDQRLLESGQGPIVLILSPTRELAIQIEAEAAKFAKDCQISSLVIYGGSGSATTGAYGSTTMMSRVEQIQALKKGAEILVATPGRLIDFLEILDEADKMLNMGFAPYIETILQQVRPDRQMLMFSATWPESVHKLARSYCGEKPIHINIGNPHNALRANVNIIQDFVFCESQISFENKMKRMIAIIQMELQSSHPNSKILIFAQTKADVDRIASFLKRKRIKTAAFHGNKAQIERNALIEQFREGSLRVLVATDVAQRGLDIQNIDCIINFDLPQEIESYVHRIGRTARAGKSGRAYSFFSPKNLMLAPQIARFLQQAHQTLPPQLLVYRNKAKEVLGQEGSIQSKKHQVLEQKADMKISGEGVEVKINIGTQIHTQAKEKSESKEQMKQNMQPREEIKKPELNDLFKKEEGPKKLSLSDIMKGKKKGKFSK